MTDFPLKILSPEGVLFDNPAQALLIRTPAGEMTVLARHMDCVCVLAQGPLRVDAGDQSRTARCEGGILRVQAGEVLLLPIGFHWNDPL